MVASVADDSDVANTSVAAGTSEVALDGGVEVRDEEHDADSMDINTTQ
jgi:hypothetical protein